MCWEMCFGSGAGQCCPVTHSAGLALKTGIAGCQLKRFSLAPLTNPQPMGIVDQMWHSMGLHVHNKLDHWSDQQPCMVLALSH